ncbi:haloalkane dehalogenase [Rhodovibrionaceae bacterium A322]
MSQETSKYSKKTLRVFGRNMTCIDEGTGDPILFLHGNPTSSYLWRNIMPHLEGQGRVIAPDLIGMGDSEKLPRSGPERYTFVEHREFLEGLIRKLEIKGKITLVIHDWGSALGFDFARRHPERIKGIAYMEGIVKPVTWADWPEQARNIFQAFRSEAGEELILKKNTFVERVLPASILRDLSEAEMAEYRRPFEQFGEDRRPTLTWPRQIPIEGEPQDVTRIVQDYADWMAENDLPKLFINAEPGSILVGPQREFCRSWKNQTEVTVKGLHFIQEDSPDEIGRAVSDWLAKI